MNKVRKLFDLISKNSLLETQKLFECILKEKAIQKLNRKKRQTMKDFNCNVSDNDTDGELDNNSNSQENNSSDINETNGTTNTVLNLRKHIRMSEPHLARHKILANTIKRENKLDSLSKRKNK